MKKLLKASILITLMLALLLTAISCKSYADPWDDAKYTADTELGQGSKTITVIVKVNDHSVKFTIHTDATIVGDALVENDLIQGDIGEFGMYVKYVNGILADYDVDQSYWMFYVNDEYVNFSVDGAQINESDVYKLEYTR